jgi:hypothetical protein
MLQENYLDVLIVLGDLILFSLSQLWTGIWSITIAKTLTSDRLFLFISDGQAAHHWYTVTGIQLLVTVWRVEMNTHVTSIDQRPINMQFSSGLPIILPVTGMHFGNKKINGILH